MSLKLHNSPSPIQYVAGTFAGACYERLQCAHKSRELINGFSALKTPRIASKAVFHSKWKVTIVPHGADTTCMNALTMVQTLPA
jgi:hypothetical protein